MKGRVFFSGDVPINAASCRACERKKTERERQREALAMRGEERREESARKDAGWFHRKGTFRAKFRGDYSLVLARHSRTTRE